MMYANLFKPIKIGSMELPNRVVHAPTDICSGTATGEVNERVISYYEEVAKGGAGFIIVGASSPDQETGRCSIVALSVDQDYYIPGLARLAEAIHRQGAKCAVQIQHPGRQACFPKQRQISCADIVTNIPGSTGHEVIYAEGETKGKIARAMEVEEIYDLIAVRVVVNTVNDCYAALGIIHNLWRPMPGRFKDYIAMPKTNMYRSIHTTLFSGDGSGMPFEVQIRTHEMHRAAEYGIAAHWMYKEGRGAQDDLDNKLAWLREALEMENYSNTTREFVENIRKDFFSDYVYVLTPQGRIIDLVTGSTPLDFAYRIHTNVGSQTQHAKVNGAIVRLDYKLKNNDVVEIITSPNAQPSRDWLKLVKTQQAKAKIRQWFKKANRAENIQRGKEMLSEAIPLLMRPRANISPTCSSATICPTRRMFTRPWAMAA